MEISKKTIWSAGGAILLGVAIFIFYLFGGFEIFSSEKGVSKKHEKQYKSFTTFNNKFNYVVLPYSIELANMHINSHNLKKLDTLLVKEYLESNRYTKEDYNKLSDFNYYAVAKLSIGGNYSGYVILKSPTNGKFISKYFLRIFDKSGTLRSQMQIAEFVGDTKFLNIKEAVIGTNYRMIISEKGVLFSAKCDSISSIFTTSVKDYKISSDGIIDRVTAGVQ